MTSLSLPRSSRTPPWGVSCPPPASSSAAACALPIRPVACRSQGSAPHSRPAVVASQRALGGESVEKCAGDRHPLPAWGVPGHARCRRGRGAFPLRLEVVCPVARKSPWVSWGVVGPGKAYRRGDQAFSRAPSSCRSNGPCDARHRDVGSPCHRAGPSLDLPPLCSCPPSAHGGREPVGLFTSPPAFCSRAVSRLMTRNPGPGGVGRGWSCLWLLSAATFQAPTPRPHLAADKTSSD